MTDLYPVDNVFDPVEFPWHGICLRYGVHDVWFLLVMRKDAIELHVKATGRRGKLKLVEACRFLVNYIPGRYPHCVMMIAPVKNRSVYNLCKNKLEFEDVGNLDYERDKSRVLIKRIF